MLILVTCYSSIQDYFKIDLILAMLYGIWGGGGGGIHSPASFLLITLKRLNGFE